MQSDSALLSRIEAEYRELPGLRLTERQMQRLWNLDRERCAAVIEALVRDHVVVKTAEGVYVHPDGEQGAIPATRDRH